MPGARREGDLPVMTGRCAVRRHDRPVCAGVVVDEEGGGGLDDVMLRRVPCDEMGLALGGHDLPKAKEILHPLDVPVDSLRHLHGEIDIGVGRILQQLGLAPQSPEEPVEQREAARIAVQNDGPRQRDEGPGDARNIGRLHRHLRIGCEEIGRPIPLHPPIERMRRKTVTQRFPRGIPPPGVIGLMREFDAVHAKRSPRAVGRVRRAGSRA
jgi:hypothetical protein